MTEGLRRLSAAFYDRVLADELLAPVFADFTPTHLDHVAVWLAEVFGGPADFSATLGGHQALLRSRLGLGIRDEHRRRWLELMANAISEVRQETAFAGSLPVPGRRHGAEPEGRSGGAEPDDSAGVALDLHQPTATEGRKTVS
ncbi:hypothetical protein I6A60_32010 [Frankia sp. AgB1.9]|uniref:globin domain-containing protein n=1 Tax=unclassified Frankia TaxID=2632575 RepID=UPI001931D403|nr:MULTISPECIES: hypothetical protein [unclassified Frankia]MBL7494240.1 hypothetical protein [Frankia sp. AgW1.1]MBL7552453.1 hypothetical protein [Frankia sp. AgB1.9]MBL7623555.1 hypothetical protein [Frankia sp. AgB1.8]